MIAIRKKEETLETLLQKRSNAGVEEWIDTWEFPQGSLRDDNIVSLMNYKFNDETGMELDRILIAQNEWIRPNDISNNPMTIDPFIIVCEKNYYVSHFFVMGSGNAIDTKHAHDHRWFKLHELESLLTTNYICPLNRPAVQRLYEYVINNQNWAEVLYDEL